MFDLLFTYGVIGFLLLLIIVNRNDIFYLKESTGKIEFRSKHFFGILFIWFVMVGIVFIYVQ
jgi:amino acid transporter